MDNDKVMFLIQHNGANGKMSGGYILDIDDLTDKEYTLKVLSYGHLLYQVGRGYATDVIHMPLEEFEAIFVNGKENYVDRIKYLLNYGLRRNLFRKEIEMKYGHSSTVEKPVLTTKYKAGDMLIDVDNIKSSVYLGNFKSLELNVVDTRSGKHMWSTSLSGHVYLSIFNDDLQNTWDIEREFIKKMESCAICQKASKIAIKKKRKAGVETIKSSSQRLKASGKHTIYAKENYFYPPRTITITWEMEE